MKRSLIIVALIAISITGCGEDKIGKLIFIKGDVNLNNAKASANMEVSKTSKITTGKESYAHIKFNDNSFITIAPNSSIALLKYNDSKASPVFEMKIEKGIIGFVDGLIAKLDPTKVKYKTMSATIGVRGSSGFIEVDDNQQTTAIVKDCCLVMYDNDNPSKQVELNKTAVSSVATLEGKTPSAPKITKSITDKFLDLDPVALDAINDEAKTDVLIHNPRYYDATTGKNRAVPLKRSPIIYNDILSEERKKELDRWEKNRRSQGRGIR